MKVIQKHQYKNGKFILTRTISEFTDYELEVLKKLYESHGLSTWEEQYSSNYISTMNFLQRIGLIYKDYENEHGTVYQMSKCIKNILEDK